MTKHKPLWMQNETFSARDDRGVFDLIPSIGPATESMLRVSQRAGGANMSVDVSAGVALIYGSVASRGKYLCRSDAVENVAIAAAPGAGSSRIDVIIARVYDTEYGEGSDSWTIEAVTGTAGPSPVAPGLPAGSIPLAQVEVGSEVAAITDGAITATRVFAGAVVSSSTLPVAAADGQIFVGSTGKLTVRAGGEWVTMPSPDLFAVRRSVIGSTVVPGSWLDLATVSIPQPSAAVGIMATVSGTASSPVADAAVSVRVSVSGDNGATWTDGSASRGGFPDETMDAGLSASHAQSVTASGAIKVRAQAIRNGSSGATFAGSLNVMMQPLGA